MQVQVVALIERFILDPAELTAVDAVGKDHLLRTGKNTTRLQPISSANFPVIPVLLIRSVFA